jgi:outer membrane immunogenic protein
MRTSRLMVSVAIGAAVVGIKAASATDLPAPVYTKAPVKVDPAYDWSGFYLGVHAGYIWGRSRVFDNGVLTESGAPTDGFVGGLLAGYNRQLGPFVLGLEGDFGWSNAKGSGIITPPPPPPPPPAPPPAPPPPEPLPRGPNTYHLMWDSHFVGKVGFTSDRWLLFATGGIAIAGFNFQEGVPPGRPPSNRIPATYVGFSVGGGVEYAFTQNLLGRLQYIYDDFGGKSFTPAYGGTYRVNLTSQTLRGGLSWKF